MSEASSQAKNSIAQLIVDLGPIITFFAAYNLHGRFAGEGAEPTDALFFATGPFMVAVLVALGVAFFVQKRVPFLLFLTSSIVLVMAGIALIIQSKDFIYMKATIQSWAMAGAIGGSVLIGKNIWKLSLSHSFSLPDRIWDIFAWRWSGFFVFMGVVNLVLIYTPEAYAFWLSGATIEEKGFALARESFWVGSKLWLSFPASIGFMIFNYPLFAKYALAAEGAQGGAAYEGDGDGVSIANDKTVASDS